MNRKDFLKTGFLTSIAVLLPACKQRFEPKVDKKKLHTLKIKKDRINEGPQSMTVIHDPNVQTLGFIKHRDLHKLPTINQEHLNSAMKDRSIRIRYDGGEWERIRVIASVQGGLSLHHDGGIRAIHRARSIEVGRYIYS